VRNHEEQLPVDTETCGEESIMLCCDFDFVDGIQVLRKIDDKERINTLRRKISREG
jgi:hypothetical protein